MAVRRPIIIGNWKMNKTQGEALTLARAIRNVLGGLGDLEVGIAPPYTSLSAVAKQEAESKLIIAAQNCHFETSGAYTGEISVPMIADLGCSHVIVGHSERRQYFGEDESTVNRKLKAVFAHTLTPVLCIGERLKQREADQTFEVLERQLEGAFAEIDANAAARTVVAYEPVWAIGTGKVATTAQAQEAHAFIRKTLARLYDGEVADAMRLQYGGSVKSDNVRGLMAQPDVDGALVGGASLTAEKFIGVLKYNQ